ncbi:MAG TPA: trypsin-like peptidase domain-containing protein [Patescibacteria group bacterium]|nr:trypsin-like peptidase domain-containing protein [Patescibacteria group bacterium]
MINDPNRPGDRDATEPVEVQHYGPAPHGPTAGRDLHRDGWQAAPAWSTRPASSPQPVAPRRGPGAPAIVAIAVVAGIVSGALSAVAVTNLVDEPAPPTGVVTESPSEAEPVSEVRINESSAVIEAVDRVAPAVVLINTRQESLLGGADGTGSGVIFDSAGWILTNRHVVENADSLTVALSDGRTFAGELYGIDTFTDLAIVKIDGTGLPTAPIGTSRDLSPGQLAIAIGNPLGYENTVTTGIVSGLGRMISASDASQTSAPETLRNLIQTDAAINPGNSGGPLVNSAGQVIGINTAVSTTAQGLGFAIPIDIAKPIMGQALAGEPIARPMIGIRYLPITPALADEQDLPVDFGALVGSTRTDVPSIIPDSPAAAAGLQDGDIIVSVDGQQITAEQDLSTLIVNYAPGDTVTLRVLRDNTAREVEITLAELPRTTD